jgi:hypothetical protein
MRVLLLLPMLLIALPAQARTVYRCVRAGTLSLATAPEPGSKCDPVQLDDNAVQTPDLWGRMGIFSGTLYERDQDGAKVYSTRNLPGSVPYLRFTVTTPPGEPAHAGLGQVGKPRLDAWPKVFAAAAKRNDVEDALLRAIAHAESGFDEKAVSSKGAQGVMQLMPDTAREYGVADPFSASQSIAAGARHLRWLMRRYDGDRTRVVAAYNAGVGAVERFDGVPPYAETRAYVDKVEALLTRYREALGTTPLRPADSVPVAPIGPFTPPA